MKYHILGCSWAMGEMEAPYVNSENLWCNENRLLKRKGEHWSILLYNKRLVGGKECTLFLPFDKDELYERYDEQLANEFIDYRDWVNKKSFSNIFCNNIKKENDEVINYALAGVSNFMQIDSLNCNLDNVSKGDVVLLFMTTASRDRFWLQKDHSQMIFDYFYATILLESICQLHQLNLVIVNTFTNPFVYFLHWLENNKGIMGKKISKVAHVMKQNYQCKHMLTPNHLSNTLLDVLLDQYETDVAFDETVDYYVSQLIDGYSEHYPKELPGVHQIRFDISKYWKFTNKFQNIQKDYKKWFQPRNHPTIEGHQKIANWLTERYNNDAAFKNLFHEFKEEV